MEVKLTYIEKIPKMKIQDFELNYFWQELVILIVFIANY